MPLITTCPFCEGQLQLTVMVDSEVDPLTGGAIPSGSGGDLRIYCESDCAEWESLDKLDWATQEAHDRYGFQPWPTIDQVQDLIAWALDYLKEKT